MGAVIRESPNEPFAEFLRGFARPAFLCEDMHGEIRLDVTETETDYQVRAQIPGAREDDIRITVDGFCVAIAADVHEAPGDRIHGGHVLLQETLRGRVSRRFALGHEIDDEAVVARLEDGVLRLTLPKRADPQGHRIDIE